MDRKPPPRPRRTGGALASNTCRCVSYICVVPAEFFPMFDHGMTTDQMPTSPLNFWASFFLMLEINCSKNLDVQLLLLKDSLPNFCPIYIKIIQVLAILSEHMHKKFEVNQTKIRGALHYEFISCSARFFVRFTSKYLEIK